MVYIDKDIPDSYEPPYRIIALSIDDLCTIASIHVSNLSLRRAFQRFLSCLYAPPIVRDDYLHIWYHLEQRIIKSLCR